ncbi:hypothetical protein CDAR_65801 [Caerostris darwini]|uniref:Uncharacterized protein n=1 Tax=Caerostris darwini TaxID=1538125 RepID=A0AAV4UC20_9ARAC|nr:hypothetical protein CDAR_65801 [Caerostris darwini]
MLLRHELVLNSSCGFRHRRAPFRIARVSVSFTHPERKRNFRCQRLQTAQRKPRAKDCANLSRKLFINIECVFSLAQRTVQLELLVTCIETGIAAAQPSGNRLTHPSKEKRQLLTSLRTSMLNATSKYDFQINRNEHSLSMDEPFIRLMNTFLTLPVT